MLQAGILIRLSQSTILQLIVDNKHLSHLKSIKMNKCISTKTKAKKEKNNLRDVSCDAKLVMKIKAKVLLFSLNLIIILVTPAKFNKL